MVLAVGCVEVLCALWLDKPIQKVGTKMVTVMENEEKDAKSSDSLNVTCKQLIALSYTTYCQSYR